MRKPLKVSVIAIVMVILLCGCFIVVAGFKGPDKGQAGAPQAARQRAARPLDTAQSARPVVASGHAYDIKKDLNAILDFLKEFVSQNEFEKTLSHLDALLALNDNADPEHNTLARFMKSALTGFATNLDTATAKGLLLAIASMDRTALQGENSVSEGLLQLTERNMYGQARATADVKTSTLRTLLLMLEGADELRNLKIFGLDTHIPLLAFIDSPDHPAGEPGTVAGITKNVAAWGVGEIVTAQRWGREGRIKLDGTDVHMDQFQAYDWVLFKKTYRIKVLGVPVPFMRFNGLVGVITHPVVALFMPMVLPGHITDCFPAVVEVAGGMTDAEYHGGRFDGFTTTSWRQRYGTAGRRHRIFALVSPIMNYYWDASRKEGRMRTGELVALMEGLNEIDPSGYQRLRGLTGPNAHATLRQDGATGQRKVVQTLEDSGLLSVVLRPNGSRRNDIMATTLNLLITMTEALNAEGSAPAEYRQSHPDFRGETLLDVAFAELNLVGGKQGPKEMGRLIDAAVDELFKIKPDESKNAVAKFADIVHVLARSAEDKAYMDVVKADLVKIIQANQNLINSEDLALLLPGLETVLALNDDPDPRRNTLAGFLARFLRAFAPLSDGQTIKGMLIAVQSIDRSAIEPHGIVDGILALADKNMYAQERKSADIKTSQLRAFLLLVANADRHVYLTINGKHTGVDLGSLLDSPDHPPLEPGTVSGETTHLMEWYLGEMVTAARWGREGKIVIDGRPVVMDCIQAYDWMFYKKRYSIAGLGRKPVMFNGICGVITNPIAQTFLPAGGVDTLATLAELCGGMTDAEYANGRYSGITATSWQGRYGTAGRRHKILAFLYPVLEFMWSVRSEGNGTRLREFITLAKSLNEIPTDDGYQPLFLNEARNRNATLRRDDQFTGRSVLKAVEDSDLLRIMASSHGPNDSGILAPSLDLLITVLAKLNEPGSAPDDYRRAHPQFRGSSMLDYLFEELRFKGLQGSPGDAHDPVGKAVEALFAPQKGEPRNRVAMFHDQVKLMALLLAAIQGPNAHPPAATNVAGPSGAEPTPDA